MPLAMAASAAAFGRRMRPSRCASCRREPPCDEIWMITFASGMSMELSPTFDRKMVFISLLNLNACNTRVRSACEVSP